MKKERGSQNRVIPKGLRVNIHQIDIPAQEVTLNAEIMDISRTGIRIRLNKPLNKVLNKVKISIHLPDSGTPFSVNCIIKNQHSDKEYDLCYLDENHHTQKSIDDMLFQCVKLYDSIFLIKPSS